MEFAIEDKEKAMANSLESRVREISRLRNFRPMFVDLADAQAGRHIDWAGYVHLQQRGQLTVVAAVFEDGDSKAAAILPPEELLTVCSLFNRQHGVASVSVYDLDGQDMPVRF